MIGYTNWVILIKYLTYLLEGWWPWDVVCNVGMYILPTLTVTYFTENSYLLLGMILKFIFQLLSKSKPLYLLDII